MIGIRKDCEVVLTNGDRIILAFFTVLSEIETNRNYYPFNNIDFEMLNRIAPIVENEMKAFNEQYGELADQLTSLMSNYKES